MDTVWSTESVWKNVWTSFYGNLVALDESRLEEGLIYVGTDDGLIQVTYNGGQEWHKIESFPGVPELTYVADLKASTHSVDTVYAAFNNHKRGDFTPYLLKSLDRGKTWSSISSNLPQRYVVWTVQEDPVNQNLLFVGTEFGLFFSIDGGNHWIQLKGNVPTIPFRDLEIQERETDLVCATFGRGMMILDDYTALRTVSEELLRSDARLFKVKDALLYIQDSPLGNGEKASQGDSFFVAPNPPFGAIFTYYLKDEVKPRRQVRKESELKQQKDDAPVYYPSWKALRTEDEEDAPAILLTIKDQDGNVVRRLTGPTSKGFHRVAWDLRYALPRPTRIEPKQAGWMKAESGMLALPGTYTVQLSKYIDGEFVSLSSPQSFQTVPLRSQSLPAADDQELFEFQRQLSDLLRAVLGMEEIVHDTEIRLMHMKQSLLDVPYSTESLITQVREAERTLQHMDTVLNGDSTISNRFEPTSPSVLDRVNRATRGFWSTSAATETHRREYRIALELFTELRERLDKLLEIDMKKLEEEMERIGAPWTPGRGIPEYQQR
jgi:hypothetical protein